jgi:hypothetical protein
MLTRSAAIGVCVAPLNGTELSVPKEGVSDADGSDRLVPILYVGIMRIPLRRDVLDPDGVAIVHAQGERRRPAGDVLRSPPLNDVDQHHDNSNYQQDVN